MQQQHTNMLNGQQRPALRDWYSQAGNTRLQTDEDVASKATRDLGFRVTKHNIRRLRYGAAKNGAPAYCGERVPKLVAQPAVNRPISDRLEKIEAKLGALATAIQSLNTLWS